MSLKKRLTRKSIKSIVQVIHNQTPSKPTAVTNLYTLPEGIAKIYNNINDRRPLIQQLSDHMGFFLGNLERIRVDCVQDKHNNFDFAVDKSGVAVEGKIRHPFAGLYSGRKSIIIANEQKYTFDNMVAMLAHERTHNFMQNHNISVPEVDNEILTDITATYLGFGFLLLRGYESYGMSLGYLHNASIRHAVLYSMLKRGWSIKEVISRFESAGDKLYVYLFALMTRK